MGFARGVDGIPALVAATVHGVEEFLAWLLRRRT